MRIVEDIKNLGVCSRPVVTVGTFDGLHLGHRAIIEEVIKRAKGLRGTSILVTFEPHPQAVVTPERAPFLLTTKEEKVRLLERTELDVILILTFTKVFSQMGARDFIRQILVGGIGLKEIIIGRNHAFGRQRQGRVSELEQMGPAFGFSVRSVSPVEVAGRRISSSWIREALTRGDVLQASKLLGRLYSLRGQVVPGTARGRMLRFPTANIQLNTPRKLYPADGVYAIWARLNHRQYGGMMNIGRRPTFQDGDRTIEVHLFDFREEIYDRTIDIEVAHRIRDEHRFESEKELVAQIEEDRSKTLKVLSDSFALTEV